MSTPNATSPTSMTVGPVRLEASDIRPLAGDPTHPDYEKNLPDLGCPNVVALGIVDGSRQGPSNGVVHFPIRASDYVRGGRLESIFICRQDKSSNCWNNPTQGGPLQVQGNIVDASAPGQITIDVDSAVLLSRVESPSASE